MNAVFKLIICFLGVVIFLSCNESENKTIEAKTSFKFVPHYLYASSALDSPLPVGEWHYDIPFYSSELIINNGGTFRFHEQGCTGHGYSEGKWTFSENSLLLKSEEKYNVDTQLKAAEIKSSYEPPKRSHKRKPVLELDSSIFGRTTIYGLTVGDTSNVYFNTLQFILIQDTLYRIDKNGLKTDTKYFLNNNRK